MVHVEHNMTLELCRFRPPKSVKPYVMCIVEIVLLWARGYNNVQLAWGSGMISIPHKPSRSLLQSTILWWPPAICWIWFKWNLNFSLSANKPYNKIHCYHLDFDTHHSQPKKLMAQYMKCYSSISTIQGFKCFYIQPKYIIHPYRKCHLSIHIYASLVLSFIHIHKISSNVSKL